MDVGLNIFHLEVIEVIIKKLKMTIKINNKTIKMILMRSDIKTMTE